MIEKRKSMTVIAVCKNKKGKLMMGGDRRVSWGYHFSQSMEVPKISKKDGILLGATGTGDLCSLFVEDGGFEIPEREVKHINKYMYHIFKPAVMKFLVNQGYGHKDQHKAPRLELPPDFYCEVVIGIDGECWSMVIENPMPDDSSVLAGHVSIGRVSVPYATGCGGHGTADAIIKYEIQKKGYITKDEFKTALEVVADISPGCDGRIDILLED